MRLEVRREEVVEGVGVEALEGGEEGGGGRGEEGRRRGGGALGRGGRVSPVSVNRDVNSKSIYSRFCLNLNCKRLYITGRGNNT
jgi:hypothetical protein